MKFTLSWLKDHLDTSAPLDEIVTTLTRIGLEVEGVQDKGRLLAPYRIASVISAEQHPNADRLRVCIVDTGSGEPVQVVCGAPNARTGMKSVFAAPGTYIPGKDITLGVGTIRGVESRGMLCSAAELEISDLLKGTWSADEAGFSLRFPYRDFTVRACLQVAFFRKCFDLREIRATTGSIELDFGSAVADRRYTF